jgi:hypothetical protein
VLRLRFLLAAVTLPLLAGCLSQGGHECACSYDQPLEPAATVTPTSGKKSLSVSTFAVGYVGGRF